MNKTNSKTKVNASKCTVKLQNSDKNASETNDTDMSAPKEKTNKSKTKNGIINGITDDKIKSSNKSNKKDKKHLKQKCEENISGIKKDSVLNKESTLVPNDKLEKNHINNNIESTDSNTSSPKIDRDVKASTSKDNASEEKELTEKKNNKSKYNAKNEQSPSKSPLDFDSPDFDITSHFRNKYSTEKNKKADDDKNSDLIEKLDNLDINEDESNNTPAPIENPVIEYVQYESELQMPMIMKIIQKDLSEPYSIYTYRYFIHNWPNLCFLVSFK